ncbi:5-deoxy-glucuronate isomerase [Paenibacillus radicis (ex Xue et al. 2023)]|uniref:5-deoxy-glucuronate isomerase n=1 Tax=Paenibacillus radicis (ex Xue et al. 2023) TaxID=2972489 RepID=A0ABT1YKR3_9BACL|nr:5-deoxy-glucuronate isomerase [Paenibacillus radicis (ex Xue et al. 2023)]MCR8633305.1 5-deoxy-glucuronate isomerase [Paenibacillus radicis (ex Xue et al. 2023)]
MAKSELIVSSAPEPEANGNIVTVTPASAGWTYVGFEVFKLTPGQSFKRQAGDSTELCAVLLSGKANAAAGGKSWNEIGDRMSVFEQKQPYSVYVPPGVELELEAVTAVELAICSAPAKGELEARLIAPEDIEVEIRGQGNTERRIHQILPENKPAESLLVVEVFTPNGHWSSYPPHKHDENNLPEESYLEETYYHKIQPEHGFAIQRVYTDDRSLDETLILSNGDTVLVPKGYHPVSAPPGYDVYYLNVMAGPIRTWKFHNDPDHEWIMKQWKK